MYLMQREDLVGTYLWVQPRRWKLRPRCASAWLLSWKPSATARPMRPEKCWLDDIACVCRPTNCKQLLLRLCAWAMSEVNLLYWLVHAIKDRLCLWRLNQVRTSIHCLQPAALPNPAKISSSRPSSRVGGTAHVTRRQCAGTQAVEEEENRGSRAPAGDRAGRPGGRARLA